MYSACLVFFQIFGMHPINIMGAKNNNFVIYALAALNLMLIFGNISFMIIEEDYMFYSKSAIGKINDILLYGSLLFAHLSIVIESFMQRKYFIQYWSFYGKIVSFKKKKQSVASTWYKGFLVKFILFIAFTLAIEVTVISKIYDEDSQWTNFWCSEIFSLVATRVRNLQHVFYIDAIFFTLQDLNGRIRNLCLWTIAVSDKKFSQKHFYSRVSEMKEEFRSLMEMIICVNRIFRMSQVFNIAQQFIEIFAELYWIYAFAMSADFIWGELILFTSP